MVLFFIQTTTVGAGVLEPLHVIVIVLPSGTFMSVSIILTTGFAIFK